METFFTTITVVLLSIAAIHATHIEGGSVSQGFSSALSYWHQKLPTTPIPDFLLGLVSSEESRDFLSLKDIQDNRKSLSVGKSPRKLGENIDSPNLGDGFSLGQSLPASKDQDGIHSPSLKQPSSFPASKAQGQRPFHPPLTIFFFEKNLHIGTKVTMDLSLMRSPQTLHFLPRGKADEIPFSVEKLSMSLDKLQIPSDSDMAVVMKETLQNCQRSATSGESKYCATSLESMIDYTTSKLETNDVNVFVTNLPKNSSFGKQQYSITSLPFQSKSSSRLVVCHSMTYAYVVYYCHEIKGTKMFQLSLKSEVGDSDASSAEVVAICHDDTSAWDPEHVVFKLLNVKPGGEAICHFMPEDHIVWLSTSSTWPHVLSLKFSVC